MNDFKSKNDGKEPDLRPDRPNIWASEVAAFVFCPRGWLLQRKQRELGRRIQDPELTKGAERHRQAGAYIVDPPALIRANAVLLVIIALLLTAIAALARGGH